MTLVDDDYVNSIGLPEVKETVDPVGKKSLFPFLEREERYTDVIGMKREKRYLEKYIGNPMKNIEKLKKMQEGLGGGILLYGPPGIGKTLLCRGAAGEYGMKLSELEINTALRKWVGDSERRIAEYFKEAYDNQPCILFIDELDGLGGQSGGDGSGQSTVDKNVKIVLQKKINDLGNDKNKRIAMVATTNKPWDIAPEMKRSGRFDYVLYVKAPGIWERAELFRYYLGANLSAEDKYTKNINYWMLAWATPFFSAADIRKICRVAKLTAIEKGHSLIRTRDIAFVLRNKDHARSGLDEWFYSVKKEFIGGTKLKQTGREGGRFFGKKIYQTEDKSGSFSSGQREIYKDLIRDVNRFVKWKHWINLKRWIGARVIFDTIEIDLKKANQNATAYTEPIPPIDNRNIAEKVKDTFGILDQPDDA